MKLAENGIDIFYIDESHDLRIYVVTAVAVPFLRPIDGQWEIVWPRYLEAAQAWRKRLYASEKIPSEKELHGNKLASGTGRYHYGKHSFSRAKASAVYRNLLSSVDFLPDGSIMSVSGGRGMHLYGNSRLEMVMFALFQRMRRQCAERKVNAMVFFDQGHPEYRSLYRKSQVYLPTGSKYAAWGSGDMTANLPLDMFVKDGNEKNSQYCLFTQLADVVAYAALMKLRGERKELEPWQADLDHGRLYDFVPQKLLNTAVSFKQPRDGIVRL